MFRRPYETGTVSRRPGRLYEQWCRQYHLLRPHTRSMPLSSQWNLGSITASMREKGLLLNVSAPPAAVPLLMYFSASCSTTEGCLRMSGCKRTFSFIDWFRSRKSVLHMFAQTCMLLLFRITTRKLSFRPRAPRLSWLNACTFFAIIGIVTHLAFHSNTRCHWVHIMARTFAPPLRVLPTSSLWGTRAP